MHRMAGHKRGIYVVASAASAVAVAACSSSPTSSTPTTTNSASTASTATPSGSSASGSTFKLGVELSMSGPLGPVGNLVLQGEKVWIASHPGATIGGKSIQLFVVDDLGTANGGASAARQLVDQDNVQAVIGPFDSDATSGSLPIFNKAGIIDVPLTAYQPAHTPSQYPYSFPVQYSDADSSALAVAGS